jgi:hypothetical protein
MLQQILRQIKRGKRAIGNTLLQDWSGSRVCNQLVRSYLQNVESDHSIFMLMGQQLDEMTQPLEKAANIILAMKRGDGDDDEYTEVMGLVRISRQLEAGLAELSYFAEHEGRERIEEQFKSKSLFFQ